MSAPSARSWRIRSANSAATSTASPREPADVASGTVSDEVLAALRTGQIKLANEQARYEIAFREDLAAIAEHMRRNPRV